MSACRQLTPEEQAAIYRQLLAGRHGLRNAAWFAFGCQTGFRISEILSMRRRHIIDDTGQLRRHITLQTKTRKPRTVILTPGTKKIMRRWLAQLETMGYVRRHDFVFQSSHKGNKPLSRSVACRIIKAAARRCDIGGQIGTHCMRKTFAHAVHGRALQALREGENVDPLLYTALALGHANVKNTLKYLRLHELWVEKVLLEIGDAWQGVM